VSRRGLAAGLVLLLPLAAGCGSTLRPAAAGERTAADLAEIKQRLLEIQRVTTMTRVQLDELDRRVATLEQRAGITPPPRPRPVASATPPATARPPQTSRPAPQQTRPIEPVDEDIEESDLVEVEVEVEVEVAPEEETASGAGAATPPPAADAADAPISTAAQALYDRGYTLYHQGRYLDAEASFQRFLQAYAETDLADNAQYWIGESREARGDFAGALAAYREVVARHPRGNKVPDALLKAGQSLERLGDSESARDSYRQVLESFPNSAAALAAEERLERMP
jgi:tol-pal system protein YbgF